jgi:hypothetical protein
MLAGEALTWLLMVNEQNVRSLSSSSQKIVDTSKDIAEQKCADRFERLEIGSGENLAIFIVSIALHDFQCNRFYLYIGARERVVRHPDTDPPQRAFAICSYTSAGTGAICSLGTALQSAFVIFCVQRGQAA